MAWIVSTKTSFTDDERRQRLYAGEVFCIPPHETVRALTDFAFDMVIAQYDHNGSSEGVLVFDPSVLNA